MHAVAVKASALHTVTIVTRPKYTRYAVIRFTHHSCCTEYEGHPSMPTMQADRGAPPKNSCAKTAGYFSFNNSTSITWTLVAQVKRHGNPKRRSDCAIALQRRIVRHAGQRVCRC